MLNPFRIIVIFLFLSLASILTLPGLNVELLPKENGNILHVNFTTTSLTPEETEQQATTHLENALSQLKNLKKISSTSNERGGTIKLVFDRNEDLAGKELEINALLRQVKLDIPSIVSVFLTRSDDRKNSSPLLVYTFHGEGNIASIKQQAQELLKSEISSIQGVKSVDITGVAGRQLTITYDLDKLYFYHLEVSALTSAINQLSRYTFPGTVRNDQNTQSFVSLSSEDVSIQAIENLPIVTDKLPKTVLKLKDVATVQLEDRAIQKYFRINGKNAVNISIYSHDGVNAVRLSKTLRDKITEISDQNPINYTITLDHDNAVFLKKEISKNYRRTIIAIFTLLVFIFLVYQNLRQVITLLLSLVVNMALTVLVVWAFKLTIHIYTLAGIAIAFGFMIDQAIIMVDYYNQYKSRKVITALIGASLATISSLMLFFFLPEELRGNFVEFSALLIIALVSSLVTNFFFTVSVLQVFDRYYANSKKKRYAIKIRHLRMRNGYSKVIGYISAHKKILVAALILVFGIPLFLLPEKIEGNRLYNRSLGSDFYLQEVAPRLNMFLGGTLKLFVDNIYEKSTYRDLAQSKLYIRAELPVGHTIEQMNEIVTEVEKYLATDGSVKQYTTGIYSGQSASIEVTFKEKFENGPRPNELKTALISKALNWGGASWSIYGIGNSFSQQNSNNVTSFRVRLTGYNYDQLKEQAKLFAERISINKKIQHINIDERLNFENKIRQEYALNIPSDIAIFAGANPQQIFQALSLKTKQYGFTGSITIDDKIYPIMTRSKTDEAFSNWDLLNEKIGLKEGAFLKLQNYGTLELLESSSAVMKEDRQYVRVLGFEYMGNEETGEQYLAQKLKDFAIELPTGYTIGRDLQRFETRQKSISYGLILLLIIANYIICSMLFENLLQPFYIIATIPVAFIGLFLVFYIFDFPFDQGGYAAFVMLCGLVVNAGLFVVHDYNALSKQQKSTKTGLDNHGLIRAIYNRGRTIILTTFALICSLMPFLVDGSSEVFWFSMAIGTIGGMLFSMFAVFIVLPVLLWQKNRAGVIA